MAAALAPLLSRFGLSHYAPAFETEALDIESLALASATDLRLVVGVPLGHALKLVHAAKATKDGLPARTPGPSDDLRAGEGAPALSSALLRGGSLPLPRPISQPGLGASGGVPDLQAEDDGEVSTQESTSSDESAAAEASNVKEWSEFWPFVKAAWSALRVGRWGDTVISADHRSNFKYALYLVKSGQELKDLLMKLAELWLICLALFIGTLATIFDLMPEKAMETAPGMCFCYHILCTFGFCCSFASIGLFASTYLTAAAVDAANFKAFLIGALGPIQLAEYTKLLAFYMFCLAVFILSVVRVEMHFGRYDWFATLLVGLPQVALLMASRWGVNIMTRLALHSGALGSRNVIASGSSHSAPLSAACTFERVWAAARRHSRENKALQLYCPTCPFEGRCTQMGV